MSGIVISVRITKGLVYELLRKFVQLLQEDLSININDARSITHTHTICIYTYIRIYKYTYILYMYAEYLP